MYIESLNVTKRLKFWIFSHEWTQQYVNMLWEESKSSDQSDSYFQDLMVQWLDGLVEEFFKNVQSGVNPDYYNPGINELMRIFLTIGRSGIEYPQIAEEFRKGS